MISPARVGASQWATAAAAVFSRAWLDSTGQRPQIILLEQVGADYRPSDDLGPETFVTAPYPEFRQRLDATLRQRDSAALRAFLIAEGQWDASTSTDPERAMWMMVASSPALRALHGEALRWLTDHGYVNEARLLGHAANGPSGQRRSTTGHRKAPSAHSHQHSHRPTKRPTSTP